MMEGVRPTEADLKERVDLSLEKGISLEEQRRQNLVKLRDFEWHAAIFQMQASIYREVIDYIDHQILIRDGLLKA